MAKLKLWMIVNLLIIAGYIAYLIHVGLVIR
jgi:hypothetical protein